MQLHNPTGVSRYCDGLGEHIQPGEARKAPEGFELCSNCGCFLQRAPVEAPEEPPRSRRRRSPD